MVNFLNLPTVQAPRNALADLSPIGNAIDGNRRNALMVQENARQQEELGMRKSQFEQTKKLTDLEYRSKIAQRSAGVMQMAMNEKDPARKAAIVGNLYSQHPEFQQNLSAHGIDPNDYDTAAQFVIAEARGYVDPQAEKLKGLQIQNAESSLSTDALQRKKLQFDYDQAQSSASLGKIIETDKPLLRQKPDGTIEQVYTPPPAPLYKDIKQKADVEEGLRKEVYNTNKEFVAIRDATAKLEAIAKQPSAASDIALIFSFMKILDPSSVVRETEFATAQNAAGVPDQIRNVFNRIKSGERLSEDQRADFLRQATTISTTQMGQYQKSIGQYRGVAERLGVDPRNVILDDQQDAPKADPLGIR